LNKDGPIEPATTVPDTGPPAIDYMNLSPRPGPRLTHEREHWILPTSVADLVKRNLARRRRAGQSELFQPWRVPAMPQAPREPPTPEP